MYFKLHLYVERRVGKKCIHKSDIEWPCENLSEKILSMCDALRDLVPFVQFKKREKHGGVLLLVKLQAFCNFTKSNTPPWVFFTFFKLYKWYQIA